MDFSVSVSVKSQPQKNGRSKQLFFAGSFKNQFSIPPQIQLDPPLGAPRNSFRRRSKIWEFHSARRNAFSQDETAKFYKLSWFATHFQQLKLILKCQGTTDHQCRFLIVGPLWDLMGP